MTYLIFERDDMKLEKKNKEESNMTHLRKILKN